MASVALLMHTVRSMSLGGKPLAARALGLLWVFLAGCASAPVAQMHPARPAQPTVHAAKISSGGSTAGNIQAAANLILLGAQLVGLFSAESSEDCAPSDAVVGAVVAQGRVWTLRASGTVCSLAQGESTPRAEALPEQEQALALCGRNGTVAVLTAKGETGGWTLRQLDDGAWRLQSSFDTGLDRFVALDCALGRVALLTSGHLFITEGGAVRAVPLSVEVPPGWVSLQIREGEADVTVDNAEAGRVLLRVDLRDGDVTSESEGREQDGSAGLPSSQPGRQF